MITNIVENISVRANELLNFVANAAQNGAEFMGDQIPLYIQEILAWEFASSVANFAIMLIPFFFCLWGIKKSYIWCKEELAADAAMANPVPFMLFIVAIGAAIPTLFGGLLPSAQQAIKVKVAPRVFLVEKASEILSGDKPCGTCGKVHH